MGESHEKAKLPIYVHSNIQDTGKSERRSLLKEQKHILLSKERLLSPLTFPTFALDLEHPRTNSTSGTMPRPSWVDAPDRDRRRTAPPRSFANAATDSIDASGSFRGYSCVRRTAVVAGDTSVSARLQA